MSSQENKPEGLLRLQFSTQNGFIFAAWRTIIGIAGWAPPSGSAALSKREET